jgi:hypothetical protein
MTLLRSAILRPADNTVGSDPVTLRADERAVTGAERTIPP